MASNAEILAQLERLAEARANARDGSDRNAATMLLSVAHDTNFGPILAAFKRLVKIEEAARGVGAERDRRGK